MKNDKAIFLKTLAKTHNAQLFHANEALIEKCAGERNALLKSYICNIAPNYPCDFSRRILVALLCDKNNMVRAQAAEALKFFPCAEVYGVLSTCAVSDEYYIVRAYALYSLCIVGKAINEPHIAEFAIQRLNSERMVTNKLFAYTGLYILGQTQFLQFIFDAFKTYNHKNRGLILTVLADITTEKNADEIAAFLNKIDYDMQPRAVQSSYNILCNTLSQLKIKDGNENGQSIKGI